MNQELSRFAARLREMIFSDSQAPRDADLQNHNGNFGDLSVRGFDSLALELFGLQFTANSAYRKICEARRLTPQTVGHWTQIPFVPTAAFKELELTSLAPDERTAVFHSSGTTEQKPSRHFHSAESLAVYEASLWTWFAQNIFPEAGWPAAGCELLVLTPPPAQAPHSSLVHMFETIRQKLAGADTGRAAFLGKLAGDGAWTLDFDATLAALEKIRNPQPAIRIDPGHGVFVCATAGFFGGARAAFRAAGGFARDGNRRLQKPFPHFAQGGIARAHHGATGHRARKHSRRIRHERTEFAGV